MKDSIRIKIMIALIFFVLITISETAVPKPPNDSNKSFFQLKNGPETSNPEYDSNQMKLLKDTGLSFIRLRGGGVMRKPIGDTTPISIPKHRKTNRGSRDRKPSNVKIPKKSPPQPVSLISKLANSTKKKIVPKTTGDQPVSVSGNHPAKSRNKVFPWHLYENMEYHELLYADNYYGKETEEWDYEKFGSQIILSDADLDSLKNYRSLTNSIMDYSILNIVWWNKQDSNNKYSYLLSDIGTGFIVLWKKFSKKHIVNEMNLKGKTILIPLNYDDTHWALMIADTVNKTIIYYDPQKTVKQNLQTSIYLVREFLNMITRRNNYVRESEKIDDTFKRWRGKATEVKIPRLKNDYDSGVYVIMYIDCVLNNRKFVADADLYRKFLLRKINDHFMLNEFLNKNPTTK